MAMFLTTFVITVLLCWTTSSVTGNDCEFPADWRDSWIENGFMSHIKSEIQRNIIPSKGRCVKSVGNKYLLSSTLTQDGSSTVCYRCMVFTVRHVNVIQYKEKIQCDNTNTAETLLEHLCGQINGDTALKTLVREHAVPIACPEVLHKRLSFSYSDDNGLCHSGNSLINKCASDKRLHLKFGACPAQDYEEKDTEIECLANWSVGRGDWLYMKYGASDYRCMFYDSSSKAAGISPDASCAGISIIFNAPTYIQWQEDTLSTPRSEPSCNYPSWFTQNEWFDLQAENIYRYDLTTNELVVDKQIIGAVRYTDTSQRHTCHRKVSETNQEVKFVTKVINGCEHGYQCMGFTRKSESVVELTMGELSEDAGSACPFRRATIPRAQTKLLIDIHTDEVPCPLHGIFPLQSSASHCPRTMEIGCNTPSSIAVKECDMIKSELVCLASWRERNSNHLVISKKSYPRSGNCYSYIHQNNDIIIDIDEKCNYNAPIILNSSYPHPPFRLPPATKQCKGTVEGLTRAYQTSDYDDGQSSADGKNSSGKSSGVTSATPKTLNSICMLIGLFIILTHTTS